MKPFFKRCDLPNEVDTLATRINTAAATKKCLTSG